MNIDIGKTIRISDIIDAKDGRSLLLDTTIASTLGATAGIENLHEAASACCLKHVVISKFS